MKKKVKRNPITVHGFFRLLFVTNWIKTLYINFKTQPFKKAIKLPIFVYGKLRIYSLRGQILIDGPISTGMIHIGKDLDHNPVSLNPVKFTINGILRFKGHALISGGSTVTVWSGEIELGKSVCLGSGVQIKSVSKITVGNYTRIVALSTVMDTNVHYVKNIKTGVISKSYAPIKIGRNCWINQGSIITKGTTIPDYCIAARNTFFNKDYSKICEPHTLLAGSPAKVLANDVQRIFDFETEKRLNQYFRDNEGTASIKEDKGVFVEANEIPSILRLF